MDRHGCDCSESGPKLGGAEGSNLAAPSPGKELTPVNGQNQYAELDPLTSEETRDAEQRAALETADFGYRIEREGLPVVEPLDRLSAGERAHFVTPVRFGRRRSDQCGHLELTSDRLRFHGALDIGVVWSEIASIERAGQEVIVSLATSPRVLRFSCYAATEAARAVLVAKHLASNRVET
jgi:hypothetical protein